MLNPQSGILPEASACARFVTLSLASGESRLSIVRKVCGELPTLTEVLSSQHPEAKLSSTVAFGRDAWGRLFSDCSYPSELKDFSAVNGKGISAPATKGDILLHIRSERQDVVFALLKEVMAQLGDAFDVVEDVNGFRYMDSRDLTGFVDGTENPTDGHRAEVALVGSGNSEFSGGSYVHCQRYVHQLKQWESLPVSDQEVIIGRTKEYNIEFGANEKAPIAHVKKVNLKDDQGRSMEILRHSLPYGDAKVTAQNL